jgi:hypothetical protein
VGAPLTVVLVGRLLPNAFQDKIGVNLVWSNGANVGLDRWAWNWPGEASGSLCARARAGDPCATASTVNTYTGGSFFPGYPWGWYIGNDGGWYRFTMTIDAANSTVSAVLEVPSLSSTPYTATFPFTPPSNEVPDLQIWSYGGGASGACYVAHPIASLEVSPAYWALP